MAYVIINERGEYLSRAGQWRSEVRYAQEYSSRAYADGLAARLGASVDTAREKRRPLPM